jgi:hypothetical protein
MYPLLLKSQLKNTPDFDIPLVGGNFANTTL